MRSRCSEGKGLALFWKDLSGHGTSRDAPFAARLSGEAEPVRSRPEAPWAVSVVGADPFAKRDPGRGPSGGPKLGAGRSGKRFGLAGISAPSSSTSLPLR